MDKNQFWQLLKSILPNPNAVGRQMSSAYAEQNAHPSFKHFLNALMATAGTIPEMGGIREEGGFPTPGRGELPSQLKAMTPEEVSQTAINHANQGPRDRSHLTNLMHAADFYLKKGFKFHWHQDSSGNWQSLDHSLGESVVRDLRDLAARIPKKSIQAAAALRRADKLEAKLAAHKALGPIEDYLHTRRAGLNLMEGKSPRRVAPPNPDEIAARLHLPTGERGMFGPIERPQEHDLELVKQLMNLQDAKNTIHELETNMREVRSLKGQSPVKNQVIGPSIQRAEQKQAYRRAEFPPNSYNRSGSSLFENDDGFRDLFISTLLKGFLHPPGSF